MAVFRVDATIYGIPQGRFSQKEFAAYKIQKEERVRELEKQEELFR